MAVPDFKRHSRYATNGYYKTPVAFSRFSLSQRALNVPNGRRDLMEICSLCLEKDFYLVSFIFVVVYQCTKSEHSFLEEELE